MTGAQRILQKYGKGAGASALAPKTNYASLYYSDDEKRKQEAQNKGDTLGGVGYVAEKLGLGLMQGIEGIWDYAVGGVSSLLGEMGVDGAQDYAERQIANDWINYNHADEWFNPGEGWKMAGDVAGGIGTSLPGIAATALVTYFTGGAGTAAMIAGLGVTGVSAAGTATKEAYQETGELGGKEFGYGAIMGAVEAGTEALTGKVLGTGLKKTADITTSLLGKGAKSVANSIGKSAAFGVAKEFASEAFEEGFTEFISPYMKRLTYDPNAENATAEEIGYAALVGGLSGVIMGGAQTVGVRGINTIKGSKQIKQGNTESIRAEGKVFAEEGFMKEDYAETVRSIESQLKALEGQTGPVAAVKRARLVGKLKTATTNGALSGMVQRSGNTVVQNAEAVAQRLNADGRYKMVDGRFTYVEDANALPEGADVRDITAEDLTKGYDTANGKKAMEKALRENEALRYVAASDAAGRFMMTATEATNAALEGERMRNEAEYKRLRETASAEERAAISQELGVDVNTASFEQFNEAVGQFKESGKAEAYKQKAEKVNEIKAKAGERAYNMPKAIALADGKIKRFTDADSNIAIARMGDGFIIYDYNSGKVTRSMTRAEVNAELARYRNERAAVANAKAEAQKNATTETAGATSEVGAEVNANEGTKDIWEKGVTEADRKAATEARKQAAELDAYCKEKIKDYEHLSAANKTMVRDVVREARAKGLSDADALSYARVSARSGLDIAFDKAACLAYDKDGNVVLDKEGNEVYHAGYYDPNENKIVVNPETTKKHAALLIHELSHATRAFSTKDGKIHYIFDKTAYEKISEDMQKQLLSYYSKQGVDVSLYELIGDEATAYYAETLFGTERAVELLLGEKPTLSEKILSFFKGAARDYAADPKLAREARRQLKQFKALFDSFSARNFGRNAEGGESNGSYRASMNIGDDKVNVTLDEDKDLVAIHNLTEKNLLDTLELGGFPMPSIAIIRKGQEHSKYGDISVIFGRETIDPKNSKYNKVYGGDAWTATYPRIEYKANEKVAKRINDKYYELEKKYGYDNVRAMYAYANELEERLNGLKGEEGLLEEIYDSTRMMQVYLLDIGKGRVETVTKEIRKEMTPSEVKMNEFFIKELGEEFIDAYKAPSGASPFTYVKEYVKDNEGRIKEVFTKYLTEEANIDPGVVEKVVEQYKPGDYAKLLRDAYRYRHEGAVTVKVEDDPKATETAIRKAADNEQYREWVDSLFKGAQEKTGIRNSKNYYDNYGNSRSWEQLHYENTIDNVIRVMREQVETGGQTIFSGNSIWGVAAKEYNSIDEVKADKERLKKLPEEEYKAMAEELGGRLEKIAQSIKSDSESNVFIAVDDAMSLIVDCVRECKTKASMLAYLKRYNKKATVKTVDDIVDLVRDIANMPTGYFEAKPRRAVDFSEIKMVELPEGASDTLKAKLDENNIPYEVYGNTDQQRAEKIDKLKNVRFAANLDTDAKKQYNSFGWVRANDVINAGYYRNFTENFAQAVSNLQKYPKSKSGEFMISVYDLYSDSEVADVVVFAKGTIEMPEISKIVKIDLTQDIDIETKRSELYAAERHGLRRTSGEVFLYYDKSDFIGERKYKGNSVKSVGNNYGLGVKRSSSEIKANPIIEFYVNEDENTVTYIYANGESVVEKLSSNEPKKAKRASMEPTATVESGEGKAELPRKAERADMTVGQLKKYLANFSRAKTYSRKDALKVVGKIDAGNALTEKTRGDIAEAIWQIYNEALTSTERQAAARDIARYFTLKLFSESKVENPDAKKAEEDLVYLSAGIGSLAFTEEQKNEIKHREDADGLKRVIGRWGFKGERTRKNGTTVKRTPLDVFVVDIAREMPGMQYLEDMNPVDAFLQIDQVYTATKEIALDKTMSAYWDVPESEIESIERSIENDIMQGYIDSGTRSKFVSMFQSKIAFYEKQAERYKNEFNEIRGRDKINGMLVSQALKMRDLKIGTFKNATQTQTDTFKKTIESLARIQWRGNISAKSTRKIVKPLYEWYTSDDVKKTFFGYVDESNPGRYNEGIAAILQELSKGESKTFTKIDLYAMLDVMGYFTNFVETYGKVYRRGQWVDAEAEAKAFIEKLPTATETRRGIGNVTKTLADKYLGAFGDPASYIRRMDNYSDGFFTQIFEDLREAAIGSDAQEIELLLDYDEFIEKNKKYLEKAKTETVEYKGFKIPKIQLIGLYMTMKQQQAHAGIAINGFAFVDTNGKEVRVPGGINQDGKVTEQEIKAYIEEQQKTIEKTFTEADREYIKVVEKGYHAAGQAKAYRDMQKYGFTNVVNDYYYPIKRANIASNVDKSDIQEEIDRVSNASFNKDRVKGAKQELFIDDADKLYRRHIHAVCQYANLSPVIDSYNMLYNYDIGGNPNHPTSIRTQSRNVWSEANSYFMKLISDVQGITHNRGVGMEAIARIRAGYAKFQLGANVKTWITQISSIFAASSLIDSRRVLTSISGKDVDKYCALARIRNYDNAAVKAQAVADSKIRAKTDSIGDALMKPIGAMDRFVIQRLFAACQSQVEADGGAKVGTEENKIAAGKLLTRVILETQQNSIATERSAAMRSDNEIVRSLTMFRADGMKVIGRVIDSYGEVKALSRQIKATSDADTVAELKGKLKKAKKKAARSMLALARTSIYTALIAQLFKWLYAKERDEDESLAEDFITDAIGNAIGGLPLITDAYGYFVEGFDLDNYSYSAINDFLASAKSIFELADGDFTDQEFARNIKNLSYSVGQIFGIPTRNIYNIFYGLTKRISPETGYAIDSVFYEKNYKNDFYKAIEQGDDDMANYILQLLMGERIGDGLGEDTFKSILDLSNKGYKILPKTVPDSVTVDGVEYDLSEDDIASVKALYGEYTKGIDDLVKSSYYANLSDEKRCEAISYYYDLARDKAIYNALGYDRGSKVKIADLVGMENLVKLQIATKGIESDKDRDGNTVAGSKRAKVVKAIKRIGGTKKECVLMIFAAGYTVKDGDIPGITEAGAKKMLLSEILKLKVSKEEKAEIARSFGFTVKGNRIVRDF